MIGLEFVRVWFLLLCAALVLCDASAQKTIRREIPKAVKKSKAKPTGKSKRASLKRTKKPLAKSVRRPLRKHKKTKSVSRIVRPSTPVIKVQPEQKSVETQFEAPVKKAPLDGQAMLTINESGAEVIIDEARKVRLVVAEVNRLDGLSEGRHSLRIVKAGFQEWSKVIAVKAGEAVAVRIELKPLLNPEMLLVEGGVFMQGKNTGDKDHQPAHQVFVPTFEIARREVTNKLYKLFVDATGHNPPQGMGYGWKANIYPAGQDDHPVVFVSWHDAVAFCRWLSEKTGYKYRLPTEAEWEKAMLAVEQNYSSAGIIWEWCSDWYDPDYYKQRERINPQGPARGKKIKLAGFEGETKALRGCVAGRGQVLFHATERRSYFPDKTRFDIGFRVVRETQHPTDK